MSTNRRNFFKSVVAMASSFPLLGQFFDSPVDLPDVADALPSPIKATFAESLFGEKYLTNAFLHGELATVEIWRRSDYAPMVSFTFSRLSCCNYRVPPPFDWPLLNFSISECGHLVQKWYEGNTSYIRYIPFDNVIYENALSFSTYGKPGDAPLIFRAYKEANA